MKRATKDTPKFDSVADEAMASVQNESFFTRNSDLWMVGAGLLALAVLAFVFFLQFADDIQDALVKDEAIADVKTVEAALQDYYETNGVYPEELVELGLSEDKYRPEFYGTEYVYDWFAVTTEDNRCRYIFTAVRTSWFGGGETELARASADNCNGDELLQAEDPNTVFFEVQNEPQVEIDALQQQLTAFYNNFGYYPASLQSVVLDRQLLTDSNTQTEYEYFATTRDGVVISPSNSNLAFSGCRYTLRYNDLLDPSASISKSVNQCP